MFRPLRRVKNAISEDAAKQLLRTERRGVFAVNGDDGYPYALPVNFYYDEASEKIYFHGAKKGYKVDCLKKCDKVCFTVYGNEFYKEGEWAPYMHSTIVYGRCALVTDLELARVKLTELARKYYPSEKAVQEEMDADFDHAQVYEITIEHLCGKQVQEQ